MSKAAPRYAKALLEALSSVGELDRTVPVLRGLAQVPEELASRLGDPVIPATTRETALLVALGSPKPNSVMGRLVELLSSRRRLGDAPAIAACALQQLEAKAGTVRGTVKARESLSPAQIQTLQKTLSVNGTHVELSQESDPSILGGFRIQLGSTVIDATANNQLNQARRALLSA